MLTRLWMLIPKIIHTIHTGWSEIFMCVLHDLFSVYIFKSADVWYLMAMCYLNFRIVLVHEFILNFVLFTVRKLYVTNTVYAIKFYNISAPYAT